MTEWPKSSRTIPSSEAPRSTMRPARALGTATAVAALATIAAIPVRAYAWGHTGHLEISELGASTLPPDVPDFVRSKAAIRGISELGPEPDVSKSAGQIHDAERDPGHYIDIDDNGRVAGASPFAPLQLTREAFDTAQRAGGQTQYSAGYLPYNIVDGWQQVRKDFALYRAASIGLATADNDTDRDYFSYQLRVRQSLTLRDIGVWSHFVADGSQPMHTSVHFNGWGNYPNPNGFTNAPIHAQFEGAFVKEFVKEGDILSLMPPYRDCGCAIEQRVVQYLQATNAQIVPLYALASADAAPFTTANPAEIAFTAERLAAGAAELRDEISDAWRSSETITVGYPPIKVTDIESGAVHLTSTSLASD